jgi:hypothetical protein
MNDRCTKNDNFRTEKLTRGPEILVGTDEIPPVQSIFGPDWPDFCPESKNMHGRQTETKRHHHLFPMTRPSAFESFFVALGVTPGRSNVLWSCPLSR